MASSVTIDLCAIAGAVNELETRVVALRSLMNGVAALEPAAAAGPGRKKAKKERDPNKPKREANAWIKFTQKVDGALKEGGAPFKRVADSKKFAKYLKDSAGYEWEPAAILKAREEWIVAAEPVAAEPVAAEPVAAAPEPVAAEPVAAAPEPVAAPKKGRKPKTSTAAV